MIRPSDPQKPKFRPFDEKYAKGRVARRREDLILIGSVVGINVFFLLFSSLEQALFRTLAVVAFIVVVRTKWDRRHDRRFWALLAALAALHLVVLLLVPIPAPRFGMEALPFSAADTFGMLALVNWVERRFWGGGGAAGGLGDAPPHTPDGPGTRG